MYLIDGPYVSTFLKETLAKQKIPVVKTEVAELELKGYEINFIEEQTAIEQLQRYPKTMVHTNSENALDWIYSNLPESRLARVTQVLKDKVGFREQLRPLHPEFYFQAVPLSELGMLESQVIPYPVILKPSVGFFSLGVHKIGSEAQWNSVIKTLDNTVRSSEGLYPSGVLDNSTFIIEEIIAGDEFAIDCYFDGSGAVVILNIMQHLFASEADVNDRIYQTSGPIVEKFMPPIEAYVNQVGALFGLENYSAHIELRIDGDGVINAIEINPLRFGGWCSTADMAHYAWGLNLYSDVLKKERPDWGTLIQQHQDSLYALIVLDNSTGVSGEDIESFDYQALMQSLSEPLELRKTDFKIHPLFGFLMCKVKRDCISELEPILHSDLKEYILT